MIFKPTSSGSQSVDDGPGLAVRSQQIDLNAENAWSELIREIVTIATSGGGRVEVRCIAGAETQTSPEVVFFGRIEPAALKPDVSKAGAKNAASGNLQPVRIVTDPEAPALQPQDVDRLYPWRQKDLLRELNGRLGRRFLNSYDIQAVRRQHRLDEHPDFVFNLPGAGRRYSPAAAEWMLDQHARDPEFFHQARTADHEIMKLRRRKPR
jgi:hypothetical protein